MVIRMVVSMKEMLEKAKKGKYAVPALNINNLEWTKYMLEECETLKSPVILGVSEGAAKYMGGFKVVSNLVNSLMEALNITVPVALHLDHGSSVEACKKALDSGFSSVMIDASKYPLEENIKITKEVVEYANKFEASIEAEIGHIGGIEDGVQGGILCADIDECSIIVSSSNITALAPALGSVHGIYKGEPNLDFDRMKTISENTNIPLVLHGATGIPDDKIKRAIECGTCKINLNTEFQLAWHKAVKEFINTSEEYDPRKVIGSGEKAMKEAIRTKILLFGSKDKA